MFTFQSPNASLARFAFPNVDRTRITAGSPAEHSIELRAAGAGFRFDRRSCLADAMCGTGDASFSACLPEHIARSKIGARHRHDTNARA
jgi:hypothetical protein